MPTSTAEGASGKIESAKMSAAEIFRRRRLTPSPGARKMASPARIRRDVVTPISGGGATSGYVIKGRMTSPMPRVTSPIFDAAPKSFFEDDDLDNFYFQQIVDAIPVRVKRLRGTEGQINRQTDRRTDSQRKAHTDAER